MRTWGGMGRMPRGGVARGCFVGKKVWGVFCPAANRDPRSRMPNRGMDDAGLRTYKLRGGRKIMPFSLFLKRHRREGEPTRQKNKSLPRTETLSRSKIRQHTG